MERRHLLAVLLEALRLRGELSSRLAEDLLGRLALRLLYRMPRARVEVARELERLGVKGVSEWKVLKDLEELLKTMARES